MATSKAAEILSSSPDLWKRYRARFARKTGDADDAGDLVGLLMERVWRYVERNGPPESLEGLVYVVYRRLCMDYFRCKMRRAARERRRGDKVIYEAQAKQQESNDATLRAAEEGFGDTSSWRQEVRRELVPYGRTALQRAVLANWDIPLAELAVCAGSTATSVAVTRHRLATAMRCSAKLRMLLHQRS